MSIVDFHSHLIPGVDDGAMDVEESLEGVRALAEQGVSTAIVTPHLDASLTLDEADLNARLAEIDAGWAAHQAAAAADEPAIRLGRGVELSLDTPHPVIEDVRLLLDGGPFLLLEFPFMAVPPHSARAVRTLRDLGVIPVIAHPERYHNLGDPVRQVGEWRDAGAYVQVNGASLLGRYGKRAREHALVLLRHGWADYLASDYHSRGDPQVRLYEEALLESGGDEQATLLMRGNPNRLLQGRAPLPVPPMDARNSLWDGVMSFFQ